MEIQEDFREFFVLLNAHKVEFIIVGGYALAFHGAPRYTGDIDVYINPTHTNAKQIVNALKDFGFSSLDISVEDFQKEDHVIQLGLPPVRIDIITSITGVSWEQADSSKISGKYGDVPVFYISREQYLVNKRATGRAKDIADIEALGEDKD